ncbi:MAG: saccharopine dehydrogenase NADP-binding domain-containing protein [Parvibaculaceae bacterium]
MAKDTTRDFDIIVYGATGFTGRLVAEYLAKTHGDGSVKWAMAGRSADKLAAVRDEIGAPADTPLVVANADDPASLKKMVESTRAVITTVGPYQLYGEPLVAACAEAGTDYVDLCGEVPFMRRMIDSYGDKAKASGARIVFSCGFDSIPFDMGVFYLQEKAKEIFGKPVPTVKGRVRAMNGTLSGGTAASGRATAEAAMADKSVFELLLNPYALAPGADGPEQPDGAKPYEDKALGQWVAPFFMAVINTRNVHRSNLLMGQAYGKDFTYEEMMLTGPGEAGQKMAEAVATMNPLGNEDGPKPGEGPSKEEREAGNYDVLFVGETPDGKTIKVGVTGDKDPGYGSTSKMIAESALCLIQDVPDLPGGFWTTAPAFGMKLIDRLRARAGLTFEVED